MVSQNTFVHSDAFAKNSFVFPSVTKIYPSLKERKQKLVAVLASVCKLNKMQLIKHGI